MSKFCSKSVDTSIVVYFQYQKKYNFINNSTIIYKSQIFLSGIDRGIIQINKESQKKTRKFFLKVNITLNN